MTAMPRGLDAAPIELKEDEGNSAEIVSKALDELRATVDDRLKAVETKADNSKLVDRLDKLEAKLNRPGTTTETKADDELERKAFVSLLRKGIELVPQDEVKSLRVSDDTSGGYLAPAQFIAEVDKNLVEFSPVRQAARVGATSSGSVILPKRTGKPTANWVGENEDRTGTESTYGQSEIPVHEAACFVDVSQRLLEDSAVNVEAEVAFDLAEEFGRLEGVAFVNGDGIKKPTGFTTDATIAQTLNGHATNLSADALISLMYALPAFYRGRGAWMMNSASLATVRKLKDGQGNYLWQPAFQSGEPATILGRPVIEAIDMANVEANAFPIFFGDWATAYRIFDRVALSVLRDPYSQATKGLVRFHARRRVGGGVVRSEAIRKLKMATS